MNYDIIIIGGGIVGQVLACLLAEQTPLSIALIEANSSECSWDPNNYYHRVSAIALSSKRIFEKINIWSNLMTKRVSPFNQIKVWDAATESKIHFDSNEIAEPVLGYIVENNLLQSVLSKKLKNYSQISLLSSIKLTNVNVSESCIELVAADCRYAGKLAIAADGANSWLRSQINIQIDRYAYQQQAIVATVKTSIPHRHMAQQVFLEDGVLAFLPLANQHMSSIVWSVPTEMANTLIKLTDDQFKLELAKSFVYQLGEIVEVDKRYTFPLHKQQAKHYIQPRIALVGDAAHTVHPLAGLGLNMGLLDAASLAEIIADAVHEQRDFSSQVTLRHYQRWRKADNFSMIAGIDFIKNMFSAKQKSLQTLRSIGLGITDQVQWLKHIFMNSAVGNRRGMPRVALPNQEI